MLFLLLNAPDIAITKASVEAGLITVLFIIVIQKTSRFEKDRINDSGRDGNEHQKH
jgi:uncharacterized MnhB-related membrane protein